MNEVVGDALRRFAASVAEVLSDQNLAYAVPGEQAVVAELFVRMRPRFPGWTVSNEYDRREREQKRLAYEDAAGRLRAAAIRPDLIVHKVGLKENLLVVEVKLHNNQDYERDLWKLRGMTDRKGSYAYEVGVHLILNLQKAEASGCRVFIDGAEDPEWTAWLSRLL